MGLPYTGEQNDYCVGTMFFEYKNWGWSERYIINKATSPGVPSLLEASNILLDGVTLRAYLLGAGCRINYARVSLWSTLRDSLSAVLTPVEAHLVDEEEDVEVVNSVQVGAMIRCDDLGGRFVTRQFRGLRDSWVEDHELLTNLFSGNPDAGGTIGHATPPAEDPPSTAVNNFLLWMKQNTVILRPNKIIPDTWLSYPINHITFRKISSRDTGRPFGTSRGRQQAFA